MNVGRYLYSKLSNTSAVTALVGTRIYPVFIPQNAAYPCIVYMVENAPLDPSKTHIGTHDIAKVTLHIWQEAREGQNAYDVLDSIDAAVRTALDGATGTAGGVNAEVIQYLGSRDGRDEQMLAYLRETTYNIIHK